MRDRSREPTGSPRISLRSIRATCFQTPEEGIGFPMSLKGFGEGFDKLR
jgi:hypothetical protein